jgi:predicted permease
VVLSEGLWKRAYGADPRILGRGLRIDGEVRTVVGVAPDALRAPGPGDLDSDLWLPIPGDGSEPGLNVLARLGEGVTLEQARERLAALDLAAAESERSGWDTRLVPVSEMATASLRSPLRAVGAAVALLLLISCLNVANLLLARGDARRRDTAVRAALGAGGARLGREVLLETGALAGAAPALGLALAVGSLAAIRRLRPDELSLLDSARLDPLVTALAVLAAVGTVLLFGALPLLHRVRTRPGAVLADRGGTSGGDSVALRRLLLVGEVALSFALLASAVQLVATLERMRARDPGIAADELLAVTLSLPDWRFPDHPERDATLARIVEGARRLPGVADVTVANGVPPRAGIYFGQPEAEGQPAPPDQKEGNVVFFGQSVGTGYFEAVGQRIVAGRGFTAEDLRAEPQPWVLSEAAAARWFPAARAAVGGRFRLDDGDWHTVVGVVADVWSTGSATDPGYPQLYTPLEEGEGGVLVLRVADPGAVAPDVRALVRDIDVEIPVTDVQPVAALYREALARERMIAALLAAFAVTAALLATVGLYGVVVQLAVRRTREFGIRISLGAGRRSIFALALRGGVVAVALGLSAGAGVAWAGLRFLEVGIAGLGEASVPAFVGAGALLAAATLLAMGIPAARAARTDPTEALRSE